MTSIPLTRTVAELQLLSEPNFTVLVAKKGFNLSAKPKVTKREKYSHIQKLCDFSPPKQGAGLYLLLLFSLLASVTLMNAWGLAYLTTALHEGYSWYTDAPFVWAESFITHCSHMPRCIHTHTHTHTRCTNTILCAYVLWKESMVIFKDL